MAITNFIPTVWGENLYKNLENKYIGVANCTREWEGDIKQCGDRVKICGVGPVSVFNYTKNTDIPAPSVLSDNARELVIDQAKAFNFQIDDIDRAQTKPDLMNAAIRGAADALASVADRYIYSLHTNVAKENVIDVSNPDNTLIDTIIDAIASMKSRGVCEDLILEVSPEVAAKIYKAKLGMVSENNTLLENGCIGSIAGCKIFVTPNLSAESAGTALFYKCFLRTKRAIAYAEQLSEIEAYRPENRFADAVKGLHLYGAKIVYPSEIKILSVEHVEQL